MCIGKIQKHPFLPPAFKPIQSVLTVVVYGVSLNSSGIKAVGTWEPVRQGMFQSHIVVGFHD